METPHQPHGTMKITFRDEETFPQFILVGATRIDLRTGEVTLPEGVDIGTAAREFWAEVSKTVAEAGVR